MRCQNDSGVLLVIVEAKVIFQFHMECNLKITGAMVHFNFFWEWCLFIALWIHCVNRKFCDCSKIACHDLSHLATMVMPQLQPPITMIGRRDIGSTRFALCLCFVVATPEITRGLRFCIRAPCVVDKGLLYLFPPLFSHQDLPAGVC